MSNIDKLLEKLADFNWDEESGSFKRKDLTSPVALAVPKTRKARQKAKKVAKDTFHWDETSQSFKRHDEKPLKVKDYEWDTNTKSLKLVRK